MFGDDPLGGPIAAQPAGARLQAFERTHAHIRALVHPRQAGDGAQPLGNHRAPALGAGGQELRAQHVAIAVDHQAGQAVGLAVHQAHAVAGQQSARRQAVAQRHGAPQPAVEEGLVDALGFVKTPGPRAGWLRGDGATERVITEHGRRLGLDVAQGHKTGYYLDQRDNRQRFAELVRALGCRSVLNCYSYTGGFSVAALAGGASAVTSVDSSAPALAQARRNIELNGPDPSPDDPARPWRLRKSL